MLGTGDPAEIAQAYRRIIDQTCGFGSQCLKEIPALLSGGREERADHAKVLRAVLGAEAAGDLLPQFHHPPIALGLVVGEGNAWIGEEAKHVLSAGAETSQQVVADPSRWTAAGPSSYQGRLRGVERHALRENGIVTSLEQRDQTGFSGTPCSRAR